MDLCRDVVVSMLTVLCSSPEHTLESLEHRRALVSVLDELDTSDRPGDPLTSESLGKVKAAHEFIKKEDVNG